ncbi:carboxymuconolactone decarboxylase family protein [Streptomyces silvisoli]|uniref:Carboxymuconolactone decarboxylase family protein n=1 Tax=Streptomyces silvisoli TaxID=3034235 RepID=A0ABT5ZMS3_9ACTN|nr:carboxymuconolactone decarboxylase family protein [Streptomyces silvisoli]MDF3291121.1 carboxymuconolactone decarboxylase family protein [Streptomyces silvisoli]
MTTTVNPAEALVPAPTQRIALAKLMPDFYKAMVALDRAASDGLDPDIRELIKIRASQLNGCAYCLDMHTRDARSQGMSEQKVFGVQVWRETPFFTARERAALALTEAITHLGEHGVPDEVYDEAAKVFDEQELSRVMGMAIVINAWNRIGVASRLSPAHRHA